MTLFAVTKIIRDIQDQRQTIFFWGKFGGITFFTCPLMLPVPEQIFQF